MAFAGIGGGDDVADAFLVEAFEAAVALEIFEVAADGAVFDELSNLVGVISFAERRRSARSRRTGQRSPSVKAWRRKWKSEKGFMVLMPQSFESDRGGSRNRTGFEVVHAGFEESFRRGSRPEADGAELVARRKFLAWRNRFEFLRA